MTVKSLLGSRKTTVTVIVFLIAFVICGVAWMRFFSVVAANPSPVRYMTYVTLDGTRPPFRQDCAGPSFIDYDAVWRFCEYDDSELVGSSAANGSGAGQWGMVRFDLAIGEAKMLWPLPESGDSQVLAFAKADSGELVVAWGAPDLSAVYMLLGDGGVMTVGLPDDTPDTLAGLAWVAAGVEMIAQSDGGATVYTNASGVWQATRLIAAPAPCDTPDIVCALQMAHHTGAGWRLVYATAPRDVTAQDDAALTILAMLEDETPETVASVRLADLDPRQYMLDDDGNLAAVGALFDQSPGNVVNWSIRAAPFVLHGGTWERVAAPQIDASFFFSDYAVSDSGGLEWIPGTRHPQRSWRVDQWVTLRSSGDDIFLAVIDGDSGPALAHNVAFAWQNRADTTLLPASDGGYWMLGPHGAYMKASADLERADALNVVERVQRAFENFNDLESVNTSFYREKRVLKMAAFPLVLLSLPLGYVVVFAVRQARKDGETWLWLLLQISAVYVIIATGFFLWFWEIMDQF